MILRVIIMGGETVEHKDVAMRVSEDWLEILDQARATIAVYSAHRVVRAFYVPQ